MVQIRSRACLHAPDEVASTWRPVRHHPALKLVIAAPAISDRPSVSGTGSDMSLSPSGDVY